MLSQPLYHIAQPNFCRRDRWHILPIKQELNGLLKDFFNLVVPIGNNFATAPSICAAMVDGSLDSWSIFQMSGTSAAPELGSTVQLGS
jgi:hypothetical protein